jgi:ribosomal-protein-alanine N-acetyltransferase
VKPAARLIEPLPGETERLAAIHASAFPEVWGAEAFADLLAQPGMMALATDRGLILCRLTLDEAEVVTLAVAPDHQRKGEGRRLMQAAMSLLAELGAATLFLEVSAENPPAIKLYTGLGFEQVGLRRQYYADSADALVMRLSLNS